MALTEEEKKRARALAALVSSDGWKMFQEFIRAQTAIYQSRVFAAKDAHEMAVTVGSYNAIKNLDAWALNNAMQYKSHLLQSDTASE